MYTEFYKVKDQWYNELGIPVPTIDGLPRFKEPILGDPVGCEIDMDDPNKVPMIKLWFHAQSLSSEKEVQVCAQNPDMSSDWAKAYGFVRVGRNWELDLGMSRRLLWKPKRLWRKEGLFFSVAGIESRVTGAKTVNDMLLFYRIFSGKEL